jgi:hypothetical protein
MTPAAGPPPFSAGFATRILTPPPELHLHPTPFLTPQSSFFHLVPAIPASAIREFLEAR